jgi:riboflavin synthase
MRNYDNAILDTVHLSLTISAKKSCNVTIFNPNTGWTTSTLSISAGIPLQTTVAAAQCYNENSNVVENKGLYIIATDTVSVFASNFRNRSFDVANVFPIAALSDEYIVQTYAPFLNGNQFYGGELAIIANEDNTTVDIVPASSVKGINPDKDTISVTLNRGQTYQLIAANPSGNFSGTYVKSRDCKKIAVFNGNVLSQVPDNIQAADHLFEQAVPVAYWGKAFAVTSSKMRTKDRIIITASKDNTTVHQNGSVIKTLNARESHEIELSAEDGSCFIETSEPCAVFLYLVGSSVSADDFMGDPSMLWISPVEQKIREITFGTYETNEIKDNYVNIVVATDDKNTVTLDGANIAGEFSPLVGNSALSFTRQKITHAAHTLRSSKGITAHVYGLGFHESYAYSVGSAMENLLRTIWIDDETYSISGFADKYICVETPIKFYVKLNYQHETIEWNFGDGSTATGDTVYHVYQNSGTYQITAIIERKTPDECNGNLLDTVTALINITDRYPKHDLYEEICPGETYNNRGHTFVTVTDTVIIDTFPTAVCDSFVYIHLTILPEYNTDTVYGTTCIGTAYTGNGFNVTPTELGLIPVIKNFGTAKGCDSIITLMLTVTPNYNILIRDTICLGDTYIKNGFNITPAQHGLNVYNKTVNAQNGCDSTVTLNLMVWQTYNKTEIEYICSANTGIPDGTVLSEVTTTYNTIHGCDSIVTVKTIYRYHYKILINDTVCFGSTYNSNQFHITPSETGLVRDTLNFFSKYGCDSTIYLNLTVLPAYSDTIHDTICLGEAYHAYNFDTIPGQSGTFVAQHRYTATNGCDSMIVLNLIVKPIYYDTIILEPGNEEQIYCDTIAYSTTKYGCDSIIYYKYIGPPLPDGYCGDGFGGGGGGGGSGGGNICGYDTINAVICLGKTYNINGFFLTPDEVGIKKYWHIAPNPDTSAHCNLLTVLYLEVLPKYRDTIIITECSIDTGIMPGTILRDSINHLFTSGGCDSITIYRFIHQHAYYDTIRAEICSNEEYHNASSHFDIIPAGAGLFTYTQNHTTTNHCDSIITLILTVKQAYDTVIKAEVCVNTQYYNQEFGFDTIPVSPGFINYSRNLTTSEGCDSIINLYLTVWQTYNDTIENYVCTTDTSIAQGTIINEITTNLTTVHGCDSIVTVRDIYCHIYNDTIQDTTCQHSPYNKYGFSEIPTTTGIHYYTKNLTTSYCACDSIVTLQLVVDTVYRNTVYDTICQHDRYDKYNFDTMMNQAGSFTFVHNDKTVKGCDSITTLKLQVMPEYQITFDDTGCTETAYNNYGFYLFPETAGDTMLIHTYTTAYGCDSVIILNLKIYPSYDYSVEVVICIDINSPLRKPVRDRNIENDENQDAPPPIAMDYHITNKYKTVNGCDSIVTFMYNYYYSYYDTIIESICLGENYNQYNFDTTPGTTGIVAYSQRLKTYKGCDSIITLILYVNPVYSDTIYDTICQYDSYNQYGFDTTINHVGDYTLVNREKSIHDCDSITTLHLRVNIVYLDTIYDTICQYGSYNQYGFDTTINHAGDYILVNREKTVLGCDSITTLHLRVNIVYLDTIYDTICQYDSYNQYGYDTTINHVGNYTIVNREKTIHNCDSITTLHLRVNIVYLDTIYDTICQYGSYNQYGFDTTINHAGDYTIVNREKTIHGCDSITTLHLRVNIEYNDTIYDTICQYDIYNKYNFNVMPAEAGTVILTQYLKTVKDCDSIVTLHLTVNRVYLNVIIRDTTCQYSEYKEYNFDTIMDQAGNFTFVCYNTTAYGCDSITTLYLKVNPVYDYTISDAICLGDNYNLHGFDVSPETAGISNYMQTLSTANGCDSIVKLQLTVKPSYDIFINDTIYEDEWRYVGSNAKYNTPGIHITAFETDLGCDSIINLNLHVIYYPPEITAFSPFNKDGVNDYLYPGFRVQIFNRYGVIIYETKTKAEQDLGWDGRNTKRQKVEPGLYFYILYNSSGKPRIKSSVEVLKIR